MISIYATIILSYANKNTNKVSIVLPHLIYFFNPDQAYHT